MKKTGIFLFSFIVFMQTSCGIFKTTSYDLKKKYTAKEILVNVSLLDRLRMFPGIVTRGQGQNAQVFIRGISAVHTPKEVLFIVNGTQVGTYSRAVFLLNPVEIINIRLLKKATEIAPYGFSGSGGVVVISTQQ